MSSYYQEEPESVTTCGEWMQEANIAGLIITSKTGEGYIRFANTPYHSLYDKNAIGFDGNTMECLEDFIQCNQLSGKEYDVERIFQDAIENYYDPTPEVYTLESHEYLIPIDTGSYRTKYAILDTTRFTWTLLDEFIGNRIILYTENNRLLYAKPDCDIAIVDNILSALVPDKTILAKYRVFMKSLLVTGEEAIFYDNGCELLTTWAKGALDSIMGNGYQYYENDADFLEERPRLVIINPDCFIKGRRIPVSKQIENLRKIGIRNILVTDERQPHNADNFREYLQNNQAHIIRLVSEENKYAITRWEYDLKYDDDIFYSCRLLLTNFLKWACT